MAVSYTRSVAYCCYQCGAMNVAALNIFDLPYNKTMTLTCECGSHCMYITPKKDQYNMRIVCAHCTDNHSFQIKKAHFWNRELSPFYCTASGLSIFAVGERERILDYSYEQEKMLEELESVLAEDSDFENDSIMLGALERIHDIANQGHIFCTCGGDISFSVNLDSIELRCESCGSSETVYAANEQDLQNITQREYIVITRAEPQPSPR